MATTATIDIHNPGDVHLRCGPMISGPKYTLDLSAGAELGAERFDRNVSVVIYGTLEELAAFALRIDGAVVEARDRAAVPAEVYDAAAGALRRTRAEGYLAAGGYVPGSCPDIVLGVEP